MRAAGNHGNVSISHTDRAREREGGGGGGGGEREKSVRHNVYQDTVLLPEDTSSH